MAYKLSPPTNAWRKYLPLSAPLPPPPPHTHTTPQTHYSLEGKKRVEIADFTLLKVSLLVYIWPSCTTWPTPCFLLFGLSHTPVSSELLSVGWTSHAQSSPSLIHKTTPFKTSGHVATPSSHLHLHRTRHETKTRARARAAHTPTPSPLAGSLIHYGHDPWTQICVVHLVSRALQIKTMQNSDKWFVLLHHR